MLSLRQYMESKQQEKKSPTKLENRRGKQVQILKWNCTPFPISKRQCQGEMSCHSLFEMSYTIER